MTSRQLLPRQFEADQIFKLLTKPVRDTLRRIRLRLAERNRCLNGDEEFIVEHRLGPSPKKS